VGLSPVELEKAVGDAFKAASMLDKPVVSVSMPELGESLQMVKRPDATPVQPSNPGFGADPNTFAPGSDGMPGMMGTPAPAVEDEVTKAMLNRKLPEVKFENVPLADVVDYLRDVTSANIFVHWRALEAAGVDKTAPVTMGLKNVGFRDVLSLLVREQGSGVNYKVENGVITIDTLFGAAAVRAQKVSTKTYDVHTLVGGSGDPAAKLQELRQVVITTIKPSSWQNGATGISTFESRLIVTAADDVHDDIAQLLKMLGSDSPTTKPAAAPPAVAPAGAPGGFGAPTP
jgi:hypothetical protein